MTHKPQAQKIKWAYTVLVVMVTWFALVLQFALSIPAYSDQGRSLCNTLVQLFSYYTILSNLLMVFCLTAILIAPRSAPGRFFSRNSVLTAVALYITIVAIIYNVLLRGLQQPDGLFRLANELLHVVDPVLFIIYWFAFVPKESLRLKNVWPWLWYPFVYFIYALIRGAITGEYPYPFLNAAKSGYPQVMLNALLLLPLMWGLGALYILIARWMTRSRVTV